MKSASDYEEGARAVSVIETEAFSRFFGRGILFVSCSESTDQQLCGGGTVMGTSQRIHLLAEAGRGGCPGEPQ